MRELQRYEEALAMSSRYDKCIKTPLLSWDVYARHLHLHSDYAEDLKKLKILSKNWNFGRDYADELFRKDSVIVVTNPDLKIIYASHNIRKMNGYTPEEIVGKSPKMFQGQDTDQETSLRIKQAVRNELPFVEKIINYRKDKSKYDCLIQGYPVFARSGVLVNYIAFEHAA